MRSRLLLALLLSTVSAPALALDPGPRLPAQRLPPVRGDIILQDGGAIRTDGAIQGRTLCPDGGCDGSKIGVGVPGGPSRMLWERVADIINVRDQALGTCAGNATIDTAAMNAALAKAAATPGRTVHLPACDWNFTAPAGGFAFLVPSRTTIQGAGDAKTTIRWNDDDSNRLFGSAGTSSAYAQDITFRDFTVRGSWDARGNASAYPFLVSYVDGLTFTGITSEYSRVMAMVARSSINVTATNNKIRYAGRDGINFARCTNVTVSNNTLEHIDDDAIAVHSDSSDPWKVRKNIVITGNRIFDAQGIKVLSARNATISGNTLDVIKAGGIIVTTIATPGSGVQEGVSAALNISVTGNAISNLIPRTAIDGLSANAPGISISGASARPGTYAAVPGEPEPGTGTIRDPYLEYNANGAPTSTPTPGSYGIIVSGNTIMRTLPGTNGIDPRYTKWSDLGFGPIFVRGGWADPAVPESAMRTVAVQVSGGVVRDVLITGNIIRGMDVGLVLGSSVRLDNIVFRGNQVVDTYTRGVLINTTGPLRAYIDDNLFDLDPFHKNPARGPNGTWQAFGNPTGIFGQAGTGVYVRRNTFRNMAREYNNNSAASPAGWYWDANIIEADAASLNGFDIANKGVGSVRNNGGTRYSRVGSDPTAADFGTVLAAPGFASGTLLGRASSGTGPSESITLGSGLSMSGSALAVVLPSPLAAGTISGQGVVTAITPAVSAAYSFPGGGNAFPVVTIGAPPPGGSQASAVVAAMRINGFGTISAPGTSYAVNNFLSLSGGTCSTPPQIRVTSVDGSGAITGYTGSAGGSCTVLPAQPYTLTGGSGTGAQLASASWTPAAYTVLGGGGGYTAAPPVALPPGIQGTAATATATIGNLGAMSAGTGKVAVDDAGTKLGTGGVLAPSATAGHLMVPPVSGTPTAAPAGAVTGYVPMAVDVGNNKVCFYANSAWRCAALN